MSENPQEVRPRLQLAAFLHRQPGRKKQALQLWREFPVSDKLDPTLAVATAMEAHKYHSEAFDFLLRREIHFGRNSRFLEMAARLAGATKDHASAFAFSLRRVQNTPPDTASSDDLRTAIDQAAYFAKQSGNHRWPLGETPELSSRSIAERCLASELATHNDAADTAAQWLGDQATMAKNPALTLQAVHNAQRRGDWDSVREHLLTLVEKGGKLQPAHLRDLVHALNRAGQHDEALEWARRWTREAPESIAAWRQEIAILTAMNDQLGSLEVIRAARRRFQDDRDLLMRFVRLSERMNLVTDAESALWKLYQTETKDRLARVRDLYQLAEKFSYGHDEGGVKRLREQFEERHRNSPRSLDPLLALHEIARLQNDFVLEQNRLTKMLRITPDDQRVALRLVKVSADVGHWQNAIRRLEEMIAASREDRSAIVRENIEILIRYAQYRWAARFIKN